MTALTEQKPRRFEVAPSVNRSAYGGDAREATVQVTQKSRHGLYRRERVWGERVTRTRERV